MTAAVCAIRHAMSYRWTGKTLAGLLCLSLMSALIIAVTPDQAHALVGISGTMSNFDVFNDTSENAYGAELELEGCHSSDVMKTYPSHFDTMTMEDYSTGTTFGTRIKFTGYNFIPGTPYIAPTVGQTTNGHYAVDLPGCEHFGFAVTTQPTATRYFWLDQNNGRIGTTPMSIPNATWTYVPPANPGDPARVQAQVKAPEPEEPEPRLPDSVWMKVFVTELEREVDLMELISGPAGEVIVPQEAAEVETEWELLEGGVPADHEADVGENVLAVIRRYEFYRYTGAYFDPEHEPNSSWNGIGEPPVDELGEFIGSNMVAVNLVPEPSSLITLAGLIGTAGLMLRRSRRA